MILAFQKNQTDRYYDTQVFVDCHTNSLKRQRYEESEQTENGLGRGKNFRRGWAEVLE